MRSCLQVSQMRHGFRTLQLSLIRQVDWSVDQFICAPQENRCEFYNIVFIDFAFTHTPREQAGVDLNSSLDTDNIRAIPVWMADLDWQVTDNTWGAVPEMEGEKW